MTSLVTGGSGFIGSELVRRLAPRVRILDPAPPPLSLRPFWVEGDVRDRGLVSSAMEGVDTVYHLASKVGVRHYLGSYDETLSVIVDGTRVVAEEAVRRGVRLVVASTSEVYGKGRVPMREDQDLLYGATNRTRWVYGMAKALSEQVALEAVRTKGLDARVFRPFNVVGPSQSPVGGLVFPSFALQAAHGGPIVVHGDGLQTRTFCPVAAVVDGILRLANLPEGAGEVVNLGTDVERTMASVAEAFAGAMERRTGVRPDLLFVPHDDVYGPGFEDTLRRVPDLTKARALLNWDPEGFRPFGALVEEALDAALSREGVPA